MPILRYKFLMLCTHRQDSLGLPKGVRIYGLFPKPKGVRQQNNLGNSALNIIVQ